MTEQEKAVVRRERAAFIAAGGPREEARRRYPIFETAPRIVKDVQPNDSGHDQEWKFDAGFLWYRVPKGRWVKLYQPLPADNESMVTSFQPERVVMWADLIQNPTEEVNVE